MLLLELRNIQPQISWQKLSVDEMAATMQNMDAAGVRTTLENLQQYGYSKDDISRFGLSAARLARTRTALQAVSA